MKSGKISKIKLSYLIKFIINLGNLSNFYQELSMLYLKKKLKLVSHVK